MHSVRTPPPQTVTDPALIPFAQRFTRTEEDRLIASHGSYQLHTAFQPIFSYAHKRAVGFEGLVRARDPLGSSVTPGELLATAESAGGTGFDWANASTDASKPVAKIKEPRRLDFVFIGYRSLF